MLLFAHNSHLQRGKAVWPWYEFWPLGSQLDALLGPRYAAIAGALGTSEDNGIGLPEDPPWKRVSCLIPSPDNSSRRIGAEDFQPPRSPPSQLVGAAQESWLRSADARDSASI